MIILPAILIIGGAGYIGSHTAYLLAKHNYEVIVIDSFEHNQQFNPPWAKVIRADFADEKILDSVFSTYNIQTVMHFASSIEISESIKNPLKYYENNVAKTITLLKIMHKHKVNKLIFSSSCVVYGEPQKLPLLEDHPLNPINPYGKTKVMIETILRDAAEAYNLRSVCLRYFNAAGALPEENLGEQHKHETHLIPLLLKAAYNHTPFSIFGNDYNTEDTTAIRDYLHVLDIAQAHLCALKYLDKDNPSDVFNLGTGKGFSVKQMIEAVEKITKTKISINWKTRRAGDPSILIADAHKAQTILKWKPKHSDLQSIIKSAFDFEMNTVPQKIISETKDLNYQHK